MSNIVALVGPTASGKSDIALKLARETGAAILSCDSLLVYQDLTIGTAKPSPEELVEVRHYGINLVAPNQPFTAGDYVRYARTVIDQTAKDGTPLLIVGGTGFYLKALLCGVWDAPPTHPEVRERIEKEVAGLTPDERASVLYARLQALDPDYASKVMRNDLYRVIRALEIIEVTGQPVSTILASRQLQNPLPYEVSIIGSKRDRIDLDRRIAERMNAMFAKGLVKETQELVARFGDLSHLPRPLHCVGYSEVVQFLEGKLTLPQTRERITISTRQLAKKQMTFFKGFPLPIAWYSLPSQQEELLDRAKELLDGR